MSNVKEIHSLSSERYRFYDIDDGVMAMKDEQEGRVYYFAETSDINPEKIKANDRLLEDIESIYESEL